MSSSSQAAEEVRMGDVVEIEPKTPKAKRVRVAKPVPADVFGQVDYPHPESPRVVEQWEKWVAYRLDLGGKVANWFALFDAQADALGELTSDSAAECIRNSLMNGWKGLFTDKGIKKQSFGGAR
jgi:hypothetical protein